MPAVSTNAPPDPRAVQRWVERLERFAARDQTVAAFSAAEGVSPSNFYLWRRRPTTTDLGPAETGTKVVPLRVTHTRDPGRADPPVRRPPGTDRRDPARAGGPAVLTVPPTTKLWFAGGVDLRLGFDGLASLVRTQPSGDPLSGHLFVFTNRSANRLQVLYWGGHGYCLWCSRLEAGRNHFREATAAGIELTAAQFAMILDGINTSRVRRFKRVSAASATPRAT